MTEIRVPTLGESVTEATIGQWLKKEGDSVKADEPIVELETDKVSVEVPAPASGVLSIITAKEGDTVELDALLGEIEAGSAAADKGSKAKKPKPAGNTEEAPAEGSGKEVEILAPASGESVTEADIGEWLVKVGDEVKKDEPVVSLETDKASMDVPSPEDGVIKEIRAEEGTTIAVGDVLRCDRERGERRWWRTHADRRYGSEEAACIERCRIGRTPVSGAASGD